MSDNIVLSQNTINIVQHQWKGANILSQHCFIYKDARPLDAFCARYSQWLENDKLHAYPMRNIHGI